MVLLILGLFSAGIYWRAVISSWFRGLCRR
jgi:hypothetical protein